MFFCLLGSLCFLLPISSAFAAERFQILQVGAFEHHVARFNAMEDENVTNCVSNAQSWKWLQRNIPLFECPDREVEEMYYFRWWSFRKHLKQTPKGFVFTEFLTPVSHAGEFNTISCAASFHIAEARWLADQRYVEDYIRFWLRGNGGKPQPHFHKFSSWFTDAVYNRCLVSGDRRFALKLLDDLVADYRVWESERQLTNGLFWQYDVRDGMEESISGGRKQKNIRPTINSYMFANARAIAEIAKSAGKSKLAMEFESKAARLGELTLRTLWNVDAQFFEVRREDGTFANVREEIGFVPWMLDLPQPNSAFESAWAQLSDPAGFCAPFGITTAERRHPQFRSHGVGTCEWDGAVWPFATCQTLYGFGNFIRSSDESSRITNHVSRSEYFDAFLTYVHSQHANGKPYIGEYLDEVTGEWINGKNGRSRYYNHSTFADLLIAGVVGLRPRADDVLEVSPLLPKRTWSSFCLDGVLYHGQNIAVVWDEDGTRYKRGKGFTLWANGKSVAHAEKLERVTGKLP